MVEGDEAIVDISVVGEVDLVVVGEGVVELMPGETGCAAVGKVNSVTGTSCGTGSMGEHGLKYERGEV